MYSFIRGVLICRILAVACAGVGSGPAFYHMLDRELLFLFSSNAYFFVCLLIADSNYAGLCLPAIIVLGWFLRVFCLFLVYACVYVRACVRARMCAYPEVGFWAFHKVCRQCLHMYFNVVHIWGSVTHNTDLEGE